MVTKLHEANQREREEQKSGFERLLDERGDSNDEGPQPAKVESNVESSVALATSVVIADENISLARYEENAKCAVIIYRESFSKVVVSRSRGSLKQSQKNYDFKSLNLQ